jgi:hypothetical protein
MTKRTTLKPKVNSTKTETPDMMYNNTKSNLSDRVKLLRAQRYRWGVLSKIKARTSGNTYSRLNAPAGF